MAELRLVTEMAMHVSKITHTPVFRRTASFIILEHAKWSQPAVSHSQDIKINVPRKVDSVMTC